MSKITRYNGSVVPFANNAQAGERFVFGSSTEQSNDLTTLVSANYLRGWGVVGPSDFPPLEWFNAQAFTSTQFIAYLHQMGIAEWNGKQEYHQNSAVNRGGVLYYCKTNDHASAAPPESDPTNWRKQSAEDVSYDNTTSGLASTDVQGAIDDVEGRVDAVEGRVDIVEGRVDAIENPITILDKLKMVDGNGSGLDTDFLRGLPADFTSSLTGNGYQFLPSGLIIQWGTGVANNGGTPVLFPVTYPTDVIHIGATSFSNSSGTLYIQSPTVSGFIFHATGTAAAHNWFSIGY